MLPPSFLPPPAQIIVGIANIMDLPERVLPRVASRLPHRVPFHAYTHEQLQRIASSRLAGVADTAFHPKALEMAAKKVGNIAGDARRMLELCRHAAEVAAERIRRVREAQRRGESPSGLRPGASATTAASPINEQVTIPDVNEAHRLMFGAGRRTARRRNGRLLASRPRCFPIPRGTIRTDAAENEMDLCVVS